MHSNNRARARARQLPEVNQQLPLPGIEPAPTITLSVIVTRYRKWVIVIAAVITLIILFKIVPTLATGICFAGALYGINSLVDSRIGEGGK